MSEAHNTMHKDDFICISETYFDSSIKTDDNSLRISWYKLIPIVIPWIPRGGIWIYYKESLAVKIINISLLKEHLPCEVILDDINGCIALAYRSRSQKLIQISNILCLVLNSYLSVLKLLNLVGDYNAQSKSWWEFDGNTSEGVQLDALTSSYGLW